MIHYGTPIPPKLEREIWHYKNANSKALKCSVFNLNWNLLLRDKPINKKVILFAKTLLHILRTLFLTELLNVILYTLHG